MFEFIASKSKFELYDSIWVVQGKLGKMSYWESESSLRGDNKFWDHYEYV